MLWVVLLAVFGLSMLRAYFKARSLGQDTWAKINLWVIGFWIAFLVNMSFTVYLEGPHGGIWYWSLMGLGVALLEWQRSLPPVSSAGARVDSTRPTYADTPDVARAAR